MSRQHRRTFLKRATAAGVATTLAIAGTRASGRVLGANDRVRIAVAGINGRGHLKGFGPMKDVEIAYLVDPDSRLFDSRSKIVKERGLPANWIAASCAHRSTPWTPWTVVIF